MRVFCVEGCSVRKIRRGPAGPDESSRFDVEQLVRDVKSAYDAYSAESLEDMWQYIMSQVARDGGNESTSVTARVHA